MSASVLERRIPILGWLRAYRRADLSADVLAGVIVAVLLVPQAMAYALLAGLPPQAGLYASLAPLVVYGLLGTSRYLAVGPVAVVSLLVGSGLAEVGPLEPGEAVGLAALLGAGVGLIQLGMGLLRTGFLVNFITHPVVSGFTSATALVIASSQAAHLVGVSVPRGEAPWQSITNLVTHLDATNGVTLLVGTLSVVVLVMQPWLAQRWLAGRSGPGAVSGLVTRAAPLVVVVAGTLITLHLDLDERFGLAVVGVVPAGLPTPALPPLDLGALRALLPTALTISLVGFLESFAVAQSLASRRRERVDGNQELLALGAANLSAAVTGGYPVTGGFSRSMVAFGAGARTGLASIVTAGLVALTLVGLTPLLFHLPRAVLAAVIVVAVLQLVNVRGARRVWAYSRSDGAALVATFAGVFLLGVENGILVGVVLAGVLHLARASRVNVAVVGRKEGSEHFRNVERHEVRTVPTVLAIRIDESLFFGNARNLEECVHELIAERPDVRAVLLIAGGINHVDATGLECLEHCAESMAHTGIELHLAEVKGPVLDRLERAGFLERLGRSRLHLSAHEAMLALEGGCPSVAEPGPVDGRDPALGPAEPAADEPAPARGSRGVPGERAPR